MVINVLRAVSRFLEGERSKKVKCAKIMLDEVIEGLLEKKGKPKVCQKIPQERKPAKRVKPRGPEEVVDGDFHVRCAPTGELAAIEDTSREILLSDGTMGYAPVDSAFPLLLDGVKTTYKEAVGKKFKTIKML